MTTGRMHSAGPVNPSQVPTREALPHSPQGKNSRPKQGADSDFPNFLQVRSLGSDLVDVRVQNVP